MSATPETANPFAGAVVAARPSIGALANTDQQRAIAEVSAAMAIARQHPRDPIVSMDRILNACTRPTLAEQAVYQYARGGTDITGPSIRLAEVLAQNWGNCQFGIRELEQRGGESTVQAFCWDVETNVRREVTFQVPHIRHTKKGSTRLEDPRDIYEMVANQGARRLRACVLSIIPGDVVEAAVAQCEVTMAAKADLSPAAIAKIVEAFAAFKVTKSQIEKRIQRHIDAIQPAQIVALKKIYTSLRDGMSGISDWFDAEPDAEVAPKQGAEAVKSAMRAAKKPSAEAPSEAQAEVERPAATENTPRVMHYLERIAAWDIQTDDPAALDLIRGEADEDQALQENARKAINAAISNKLKQPAGES